MPFYRGRILAFAAFSLSLCTNIHHVSGAPNAFDNLATCQQIANAISGASQVFYPLSPSYTKGVSHWASSSSEVAACVVEPGTAADVGTILQIVGQRRTPFAVKGGGHASNVHFSSTTGVHIAMSRFDEVTYSAASQTAAIGAGLVWDDVYAALEPFNVSVVGGRVSGVGVAGFTLGGGYSWKSSQYGLTVDTVVAYELVLPNGTVTEVTASNADLFFALKGGFNNFGIVTKFVLRTFPQTQVFGGYIVFTADKYPQILNATERFTNGAGLTDPKAAMLISLSAATVVPIATVIMFYDAPTAPPGTFDDFLNIPGAVLSDVKTRSLLSVVQGTPSTPRGLRGAFETVSTTGYNMALLNAVANETTSLFSNLGNTLTSGLFISYALEPFHPSLFTHNTPNSGTGGSSAYPPTRTQALFPLNLYFAWALPLFDTLMQNSISSSARSLEQVAGSLGLLPPGGTSEAWLYGNYALTGTPVQRIYGGNLQRLASIRASVDPGNVMGLAGGWKV